MLTKLQAINAMLAATGESVVLIRVDGASDVANAESVLDHETLAVLAIGWDCNVDDGVSLQPDVSGHIAVPADALQIDAVDPTVRVVARNGRLWNKDTLTDVFADPVSVRIVRSLDFETLPFHLQNRITAQATVRYQASYVGSPTLDAAAQQALLAADAQAQDAEADGDDYNLLDNADIAWFRRNTPRSYR